MYIRRLASLGIRDVVFFAAFAVYVWAGIDTRLIDHWQGTVLSTVTCGATSAGLEGQRRL